jgi:hypothetical protein
MKTEIKDINGEMLYTGNLVRGFYGIQPVKVEARVKVKGEKYFYIGTKEHNPQEYELSEAVKLLNLEKVQ